jgi:hypothetical protein
MQVIAVARWAFWAGVLALVACYVIQTVIGTNFDPYSGVSYNESFVPVMFAFFLFLVSAVFGRGRIPENVSSESSPSFWIGVERWTFWAGTLVVGAGFLIQAGIGAIYNLTQAASFNVGFVAVFFALALFIVSAVLGGGRVPESAPSERGLEG